MALQSLGVSVPTKRDLSEIFTYFLDLQIQKEAEQAEQDQENDNLGESTRIDALDCDFLRDRLADAAPFHDDARRMQQEVLKRVAEVLSDEKVAIEGSLAPFR